MLAISFSFFSTCFSFCGIDCWGRGVSIVAVAASSPYLLSACWHPQNFDLYILLRVFRDKNKKAQNEPRQQ
jgi:hypothetical protein